MSQYAERDIVRLGEFYTRHVHAMTAEGLHAKSAIAAELAWRDAEIARLRGVIQGVVVARAFGESPSSDGSAKR